MTPKLTYKSSGVDISKARGFIKNLERLAARTMTPAVLKSKGAFGSLLAFPSGEYQEPVLVSSSDGVGTKLLIAQMVHQHDTVGIDLVAMNVNDLLCLGAKPLFFLDYIACGKLKPSVLNGVMRGIVQGCELAGCPLLGGETAQMPGMYKGDGYDLAGFAVGVVEKSKIIDGSAIKEGDRILGLAASGLHSNGFSLVRKVFSLPEQRKYAKELLQPTRIYVKPILRLIERFSGAVKGLAHVTGGAYYKKVAKIIPPGKCFKIDKTRWPTPEIFQRIQKKGRLSEKEMFTTFNMGIGMVLVVPKSDVEGVRKFLSDERVENWEIGEVVNDPKQRIRL